jgi:hypothetical protein
LFGDGRIETSTYCSFAFLARVVKILHLHLHCLMNLTNVYTWIHAEQSMTGLKLRPKLSTPLFQEFVELSWDEIWTLTENDNGMFFYLHLFL